MEGLLLIDKEKDYTSRDIVNIISKKFNTKKVGHFGTLDPLATGLLLVGIGSYTKVGNFLLNDNKTYECEVLIGTSTDTYDITGNISEKKDVSIDKEVLEKSLLSFKKTYIQEVPIYSAVKVNGKKLYEYARSGSKVELPKKEVTIFDIKLLEFNNNTFKFSCNVSKGTYIRSIINDLSKDIGIPLCMKSLRRVSQDKFNIKDSYTLNDIENNNYKLLSIEDILDLEKIEITSDIENKVLNGNKLEYKNKDFILYTKNNKNIVLYKKDGNYMKPVLFFNK